MTELLYQPICATCGAVFSPDQYPLCLPCSHHLCTQCLSDIVTNDSGTCPFDDSKFQLKDVTLNALVAFKGTEIRYYVGKIEKTIPGSLEYDECVKSLAGAMAYIGRVMNLSLVPCWSKLLFGRCSDLSTCRYDHELTRFKQQICRGYGSKCTKTVCFYKHGEADTSMSALDTTLSRMDDSFESEVDLQPQRKWVVRTRRSVCAGQYYTVGTASWEFTSVSRFNFL